MLSDAQIGGRLSYQSFMKMSVEERRTYLLQTADDGGFWVHEGAIQPCNKEAQFNVVADRLVNEGLLIRGEPTKPGLGGDTPYKITPAGRRP